MTRCAIEGCERPRRHREWCGTHYARWRRSGSPTGSSRRTADERFWASVRIGPDCWEWQGFRMPSGHGRFGVAGRDELTHRYSWTLAYGAIPAGMSVLHRCDNPPCVRPDHLFLGTRADNVRDMYAKGRERQASAPGERNGQAKLTWVSVHAIRAAAGVSSAALASEHGVTTSLIAMIRRGVIWREDH